MGADGATTVRLCGPLGVELAGREAVLPGRQGRLAFAYLVVNRRRAVGRDELIELLWPQSLPADPAEALSALLSRVRRAVGADVLCGRRELELVLPAGAWVDLEVALDAAERADAALAAGDDAESAWSAAAACAEIAGGGFLAGDEAPWAHDRRREVGELRLRALEAMAAAGIGLGGNRLADAERAAREAIEAAPFRESGHRLLMAALAARGNVAEALRAYEDLRVLLRDEIGTAPGADVQALHRRLLTEGGIEEPLAAARSREERRLVTVLCAELTQLATPLDPEELRPVEAEAQRHACAVVEGFGATAHALSAGVLVAVFGAPVAHEDDAERAVRAGLRICELRLATRAGVASGEAIVALGGPQPGTATGGMTSAAVALQRVAPPGGTAVDAATREATADALCFEPIAGTAAAWRATGEAAAPPRTTRFVGRDRELALLRELHDATLSERRPHLVTVVGEAGIGKTRLLEEVSSRVAVETGCAVHRGRCLAYGEGVAYWALREILWDAAGVLLDDSVARAAGKLTGLVRELLAPDGIDAAETQRVTSALAASAGLTLPGSTLRDATPESVAEEIGLAWPRFLSALAARTPTVVAIEDLHWAEPALLDMVEAILARSEGPLLVLGIVLVRDRRAEHGHEHGRAQRVRGGAEALDDRARVALSLSLDGPQLLGIERGRELGQLGAQHGHEPALLARARRRERPPGSGWVGRIQQAAMQRLHVGAWRRAQLVAQQDAQVLVGAQRLGDVAVPGERRHEQPVAALAKRRRLDRLARGPLGVGQPIASERDTGARHGLQRAQPQLGDLAAAIVRPWGLVAR